MTTLSHTSLSRRKFLAGAAATAVAPMILPASRLFGANTPNNLLNLAVIGCGGRATGAMLGPEPRPGVRFIAAVDPFRERRESFAAKLNEKYGTDACKPYADFREVVARDDLDGIAVFTPDHWHVPVAYIAAGYGKDMYVEKPLGVAMKWAWKLRRRIERTGVIFQYGTQQRSRAQFRRACELVRNGYIGNIERVDAWCASLGDETSVKIREEPVPDGFDYDLWTGPSPMRPYQPERVSFMGSWHTHEAAIGFIAGWGAHPLDIAQWGLKTDHTGPVRYEGSGTYPTADDELYNTTRSWDIHCEYASGVKMHFMDARTARPIITGYHPVPERDHGTAFHGDEGWIIVDRTAMYASDKRLRTLELKPSDERLVESHDHFLNFIESMRSRRQPISPFEAAIRGDTISHLSEIVVRTGRSLDWDPKRERIRNASRDQTALLDRRVRREYRF